MSDLNNGSDSLDENGSGDGDSGNDAAGADSGFKAITSQEDFDKAVQRRISRVEKKYEGFNDLKAKADQFDKLEAERGTEAEKLLRRAEKAEQERDAFKDKLTRAERLELVRDVADELGLPKKLVKRVQGDSEDDIRADIEDLLEGLPKADSGKVGGDDEGGKAPPSPKPKEKITFTAPGDGSDEGMDLSADDILKDLPRNNGIS